VNSFVSAIKKMRLAFDIFCEYSNSQDNILILSDRPIRQNTSLQGILLYLRFEHHVHGRPCYFVYVDFMLSIYAIGPIAEGEHKFLQFVHATV
jgi:hypothetical protein